MTERAVVRPTIGPNSPSDGRWNAAVKAARARGDQQEVDSLRGSILLLMGFSSNPDVPDEQWEELYNQMSSLHGLSPEPNARTIRNGWRNAAGLMLVK